MGIKPGLGRVEAFDRNQTVSSPEGVRGITLVELMVALTIGLLLVAVCLAMSQSTSSTYAAAEALSRMQENERLAFELMATEVREAGQNACESSLVSYNVLRQSDEPSADWYTTFESGIRGYGGTQAFPETPFESGFGRRIYGTPAIELKSATADSRPISAHDPISATITLGGGAHSFSSGDLVVACDFAQLSVLQLTEGSSASMELHHVDGVGTPGNCTRGLGWSPTRNCTPAGNSYALGCYRGAWSNGDCKDEHPQDGSPDRWPSSIAKLKATRWFLGRNDRAGHSLFRIAVRTRNGTPEAKLEEVLPNITDLEFTYMLDGTKQYVGADAITDEDWRSGRVSAVRIGVTVASPQKVHGVSPERRLEYVVAVRRNEKAD